MRGKPRWPWYGVNNLARGLHLDAVNRDIVNRRIREKMMDATPQIRVTLSNDLLEHLRREAVERHVPLRWLVAGLVCDTLENGPQPTSSRQPVLAAS
jgi:hypothetical protein